MNAEDRSQLAVEVVDQVSAMIAYWDTDQRCVFANQAYLKWFGMTPARMIGITLKELLGPIYELNLPYIQGALKGEKQVFERRIPLPDGTIRDSIATYTPEIVDGIVRGFSVHVADVTILREREAALQQALRERDEALAVVHKLEGLLPICAFCKSIRDENGDWQPLEAYITKRSEARFTHGFCPNCGGKHYAGFLGQPEQS